MLPLIENDARPLLEALISEVSLLVRRVRRAGGQRQALLLSPNASASKIPFATPSEPGEVHLAPAGLPRTLRRASIRHVPMRRPR
jgi:hypothetical protein